MSKSVFDASALLAYYYDEPGGNIVESALSKGAVISTANWVEVLSKCSREGEDLGELVSKIAPQKFYGLVVSPITENDALKAAELYLPTKNFGLSLGDRICLALGLNLGLTILTADRVWKNLNLDIPIVMIR